MLYGDGTSRSSGDSGRLSVQITPAPTFSLNCFYLEAYSGKDMKKKDRRINPLYWVVLVDVSLAGS